LREFSQNLIINEITMLRPAGLNSRKISISPFVKLFKIMIAIFFLLSLVIPTTFQFARGIFLGALIFMAIAELLARRSFLIHHEVSGILFLCLMNSMLSLIIGASQDAPGTIPVMSVYIAWPLVYVFFISLSKNPKVYFVFIKLIVVGSFISAVLGILLIVETLYGLDFGLTQFWESQDAIAGIYEGQFKYQLSNNYIRTAFFDQHSSFANQSHPFHPSLADFYLSGHRCLPYKSRHFWKARTGCFHFAFTDHRVWDCAGQWR
jgi:hypothetical protein